MKNLLGGALGYAHGDSALVNLVCHLFWEHKNGGGWRVGEVLQNTESDW